MKKSLFLSLILGLCAFAACNEAKIESSEDQVVKLVANPDFVFTSGSTTLFSTFATKADPTPDPVVTDANVEANLSVCAVGNGQYNASKLSLHIRMANDVTVFLPVAASALFDDPTSAVNVFKETQTRTGGWGENSAYFEIDGNKVTATVAYAAEGITVTVTGVNDAVAKYLYEGYKDGLTVEVWNYYNESASLESLRDGFNAGATISFTEVPNRYVNAFAKIPDYIEDLYTDTFFPRIISKTQVVGGKEFLYPYLDNETELAADYWVRPLDDYGDGTFGPSYFYLLRGKKNAFDCVVKPVGATFSQTVAHNADIPDDVETVYYTIPGDYNVIYTK